MDQVQASKAVLIEIMNVLGVYRDHLILIGGWVPELLLPGRGHIGSLDVDLAVDVRGISQRQYDTILQRLIEAGYRQQTSSFRRQVGGAQEPVKVDFVTGEYIDDVVGAAARCQEIGVGKLRGMDLAFEAFEEISVTGTMPDGAVNTVRLRVVSIEAFLILKAFAMADRIKPKDAYDIYFWLRYYPGGVAELAQRCGGILKHGLFKAGLQVLREKFGTSDAVGPRWAAQMVAEKGLEDPQLIQRDAFERMQAFLAFLSHPPIDVE